MEEVAPEHDLEQSSEEFVAHAVVSGGKIADIEEMCGMMVGSMEPPLPALLDAGLVRQEGDTVVLSELAKVMAAHFLGMDHLIRIQELVAETDNALEIVAALDTIDSRSEREEKERPKKRAGGAGSSPRRGESRRRRRR